MPISRMNEQYNIRSCDSFLESMPSFLEGEFSSISSLLKYQVDLNRWSNLFSTLHSPFIIPMSKEASDGSPIFFVLPCNPKYYSQLVPLNCLFHYAKWYSWLSWRIGPISCKVIYMLNEINRDKKKRFTCRSSIQLQRKKKRY